MKKTLFIILALCSMSYGLSGYSMYKTYVAKDTVTHINLDSNFYRGVNWSNKLVDTVDKSFIRWYDFNSHDSTLRYFKVDTIRSNPHVDSISGNTVITGAPIVTGALTVDSLKSTKGINATGGTFSGALTGTTLNTGNGANELYAMDQNVRTSDAVTFTTVNTGYGANELHPMDQPVRTTDAVNFDSIVLSKGLKLGTNVSGPTSTPYRIDMGNTYSNGVTADKCKLYLYHDKASSQYYGIGIGSAGDIQYHSKTSHNYYIDDVEKIRINSSGATVIGSLTSNTLNTGNGANELYAMDQNVRTSDAVTFTTVNTGYGANELHPMNQGVRTTDDVTFDSTRTRVSVFDSLQLGTGSYLKTYLDTTFYDSLYCNGVYSGSRGVARIIQIGKQITLYQPSLSGTVVASSTTEIRGIPSKFRDGTHFYYPQITISENSVNYLTGILRITTSQFIIQKNGEFLAAGNGGIYAQCITWFVN